MGRELRRVSLDFNWQVGKTWEGFLNPFYAHRQDCPTCGGTGESIEGRIMKDRWYGNVTFRPEDRGSVPFTREHPAIQAMAERHGGGEAEAVRLCGHFNKAWCHHLNAEDVAALVAAGRLMDFTHTWAPEVGWKPKAIPYLPTPEEVNEWSLQLMGHDSCNQWVVVKAECERLGLDPTCSACQGTGDLWESPEMKQKAEDWAPTNPPEGEGYQIWETVSEGSPISPVFPTPEALASHMANTCWGSDRGSSYDTWLAFINGPGWAPSMVIDSQGIRTGPEAAFPRA